MKFHGYKSKKRYYEYVESTRESRNRQRRLRRKRNREQTWNTSLKEKYGITSHDFLTMLKAQGGKCAICRKKETMLDNKGRVRLLCVDHDHKTNKVRKLLCWRCNLALGIFQDSYKLLQAATNYLKNEKAGYGTISNAETSKS